MVHHNDINNDDSFRLMGNKETEVISQTSSPLTNDDMHNIFNFDIKKEYVNLINIRMKMVVRNKMLKE